MINWQPIETAPKDGRAILIRDADEAVCEEAWWDGFMWGNADSVFTDVQLWMPLTSPPVPGKEE